MKSSLGKLRRLALHKSVGKEKMDFQPLVKLDELAQAAKDMQEMRNCYDSLLSAAAATANSAYEFSESLQEMGTCLLEKTSVNDDEESGKMLGMLGRVQLELQKLIDSYRSHIIVTITNPSESLLSELRTVEDMKRQCDEKREVYEYMIAQQKEKGRSKSGKGENITSQQLQAAHDEYREEATLCAFRLKSLKQGQPRSLLTQAARHYAAQLNFFRKGLKSLEAVEPHIRLVTKQQHIDYQFSELEEDDDGEDDSDANEGDELSFDYKQGIDVFSTTQNSKEVEESSHSYLRTLTSGNVEMSLDKNQVDIRVSNRESRVGSHSAPIIAEKKFDPAEKVKQLLTSSWAKSNPYVLPRPVDIKETNTGKTSSSIPSISASGRSHNLWHSSPLDEKKEKDFGDGKLSGPTIPITQSVLKESNSDNTSNQLQRPALSASSLGLTELPPLVSRVLSRLPMPHPSSPKTSPSASPPLVSSPRISELHELPLPPNNQSTRPMKSYQIGHSAPLVLRNQERSATNKSAASPLPTPPLIVSRSFSIPSSSQRAMTLHVTKLLDAPQVPERAKEVASPLSFSDIKRVPSISDLATHSSEIQVDAGGS